MQVRSPIHVQGPVLAHDSLVASHLRLGRSIIVRLSNDLVLQDLDLVLVSFVDCVQALLRFLQEERDDLRHRETLGDGHSGRQPIGQAPLGMSRNHELFILTPVRMRGEIVPPLSKVVARFLNAPRAVEAVAAGETGRDLLARLGHIAVMAEVG